MENFAAFILTHGRPNKVYTINSLRKSGYTGRIVLLVDDLDKTKEEYIEKYGDEVHIFDKKAIAKTFDQADNFNDMRTIIYARNASFEVAKNLGIKYFIQLDDDYTAFRFRYNDKLNYCLTPVKKNLDGIFSALVKFHRESGIDCIAVCQGGDFIGGSQNRTFAQGIMLKRKCMNSFICSTDRPFKFIGRINEDVNTYTRMANTGLLMFTANQVSIDQKETQSNSGGMTELYLDSGTYVKSFYSVMYLPSAITVKVMRSRNPRLHHSVSWKHAVPVILRESVKKI